MTKQNTVNALSKVGFNEAPKKKARKMKIGRGEAS